MIESVMYFGLGFLVAALSVLAVVPLVHGRAVRLTTRRVKDTVPSSVVEILTDKDLLRAEFAMSTRRLEMNLERLRAKSASHLLELGKKDDAINRLKTDLYALRDQLRTAEEKFALKAKALQESERALPDKESELAKLMSELAERSRLADAQKIEIVALKTDLAALKVQMDGASEELKAAEKHRDAQRIELMAELGALRDQLRTTEEKFALNAQALQESERALRDKESELAKLMSELAQRSRLADVQKIEIVALKTDLAALKEQTDGASEALKVVEKHQDTQSIELMAELGALRDQLRTTEEKFALKAKALQESERALSDKEWELAKRSTLADAQVIEIVALKTEAKALHERLNGANNELKAVEDHRNAERIEHKAATQKFTEERNKFEKFHRRAAELLPRLVAQRIEDKIHGRNLENSFVEQSQRLNECELELQRLRDELEIAGRIEADLRNVIIEIDARANTAIREKDQVQAALDRTNGEFARLAHKLVHTKRLAEQTLAAQRVENAMQRECTNDVAAEEAHRAAFGYGQLAQRAS